MVVEDEGDEGTRGQAAAAVVIDRVVIDGIKWAWKDRTEIYRVLNRKEVVGRLADSG
jgi:hypothetical protein